MGVAGERGRRGGEAVARRRKAALRETGRRERRGAALYLKEHNDGAVGSELSFFSEAQGTLLFYLFR